MQLEGHAKVTAPLFQIVFELSKFERKLKCYTLLRVGMSLPQLCVYKRLRVLYLLVWIFEFFDNVV